MMAWPVMRFLDKSPRMRLKSAALIVVASSGVSAKEPDSVDWINLKLSKGGSFDLRTSGRTRLTFSIG